MRHLGVEIELTGIKRSDLVKALENLFHTTAKAIKSKTTDDGYTYHKIPDEKGNYWTVVRDRSVKPQKYIEKTKGSKAFRVTDIDDKEYMVELVSPVLTNETLPTLFTVVSVIKSLGGLVNETCGIHVHIDKMELDDCISLFKRWVSEQDAIFNSFEVKDNRRNKYCKLYADVPLEEFEDLEGFLQFLWVNYRDKSVDLRHVIRNSRSLRYYGLNFHSLLTHGTIEYRIFNSTLDNVQIAKILKWVLDFSYPYNSCIEYNSVFESFLLQEIVTNQCTE